MNLFSPTSNIGKELAKKLKGVQEHIPKAKDAAPSAVKRRKPDASHIKLERLENHFVERDVSPDRLHGRLGIAKDGKPVGPVVDGDSVMTKHAAFDFGQRGHFLGSGPGRTQYVHRLSYDPGFGHSPLPGRT